MEGTIGRPERNETIDFYHPYIDLVPDGDIRRILEVQSAETLAFFETIPNHLASHR